MQLICVGKDLFTQVDDCDWVELYSLCNWRVNAWGYVVGKKKNQMIFIHKFIYANIDPSYKGIIDHEDRDRLNNQQYNLRPATKSQNIANSRFSIANKTGYRGVSWSKQNKNYQTQIRVNNTNIHLGYYDDLKEAAKIYNIAAKKYFGDFAILNPE